MAKQIINIGTSENKGDGDPLRTAFDKVNQNFNELYAGNFADVENIGVTFKPDADGSYDLGSAERRWGELHVKDFIYIGGVRLSVDALGNLVVGGGVLAIQDVQGDIFADDSTKVFDSATATFSAKFDGDLTGSVFSDDSTVMVDAVNNTLHADTVNAVGFQGSFFGNGGLNSPLQLSSGLEGQTGNTIFINPQGSDTLVQMWGETVNLVTGPFNTYDSPYMQFKTEGAFKAHQGAYFDGDLTGSVFADDSTLLVDGVNGTIPGYISLADLKTEVAASTDFEDFQTRIAAL